MLPSSLTFGQNVQKSKEPPPWVAVVETWDVNQFPFTLWTSNWPCPGLCSCGDSEPPDLQFVLLSPVLDSQQPWLYVSALLVSDQSRLPNHTVTGKTPGEVAWSLLIFCPSVWGTQQAILQSVSLCLSTEVGSQLLHLPCMIEMD